jgi:hypothetical protein
LETALVRIARTDLDVAPSALLARIDRLERGVNAGGGGSAGSGDEPRASVAPPPSSAAPVAPAPAAKRPSLRIEKPPAEPVVTAPAAQAEAPKPKAAPKGDGTIPDRDALTLAWGDTVLDQISPRAKARFRGGHWVDAPKPTFALPTEIHKQRCDEVRLEVQEALSQYFGVRIELTLTVDKTGGGSVAAIRPTNPPGASDDDVVEDVGDVAELEDAPPVASGAERLLEAFPGAAVEEPNE